MKYKVGDKVQVNYDGDFDGEIGKIVELPLFLDSYPYVVEFDVYYEDNNVAFFEKDELELVEVN